MSFYGKSDADIALEANGQPVSFQGRSDLIASTGSLGRGYNTVRENTTGTGVTTDSCRNSSSNSTLYDGDAETPWPQAPMSLEGDEAYASLLSPPSVLPPGSARGAANQEEAGLLGSSSLLETPASPPVREIAPALASARITVSPTDAISTSSPVQVTTQRPTPVPPVIKPERSTAAHQPRRERRRRSQQPQMQETDAGRIVGVAPPPYNPGWRNE